MVIYLGRFIKGKMPPTDDQRKRISTAVALAGLAAVAVVSPLTWSGIMTEAAKMGDRGVIGVLDTTGTTLAALTGAGFLLLGARMGLEFNPFAACLLMGVLTFAVAIELAARNVSWAPYLA